MPNQPEIWVIHGDRDTPSNIVAVLRHSGERRFSPRHDGGHAPHVPAQLRSADNLVGGSQFGIGEYPVQIAYEDLEVGVAHPLEQLRGQIFLDLECAFKI